MKKPAAVSVEHLTVKFGPFTAVEDISFEVQPGEIFGFLGANGAGKTTTIRVLCGLLLPTSGEAHIAGRNFDDGAKLIKEKVGYMSQKFTLYNDLTVEENLAFTAALRKMGKTLLEKRTQELFHFVGFEQSPQTLVRDLPGGIKQELSLVASLLHDPHIIFLDEPTAGVSPASRSRFWKLIHRLSNEGKTIFVTTHYMDEAEECQRIALMRSGRIIALDTPDGLKQSAFPEKLYEIQPHEKSGLDWKKDLLSNRSITLVAPYGLRYHVGIRDEAQWNLLTARWGAHFSWRPIAPSLEDVFIRLVEGLDR